MNDPHRELLAAAKYAASFLSDDYPQLTLKKRLLSAIESVESVDWTITIEVEGGCVSDVHELPPGWSYVVDDHDVDDEEDEDDEPAEHVCDDDCRSNGCPVVRAGGAMPGEEDAEPIIATFFENHYKCYRCGHEWVDLYECMVDDECPECDAENCSPHTSNELTTDLNLGRKPKGGA